MRLSARDLDFRQLNERIRASSDDVEILDCCGQRFIGTGLQNRRITIRGTPGNALGAYLNGASIEVFGNAQDAVGDTMNDGWIIIHGNAGDALGYAMRGGRILVRGDAGYRTGVHLKEYGDKKPVLVIGGRVGSFLGEYQAGGLIIVLGLGTAEAPVGNFTGTGMHGGQIWIRTAEALQRLPPQVKASVASDADLRTIEEPVRDFAEVFGLDADALLKDRFELLVPDARNPYRQLYTAN